MTVLLNKIYGSRYKGLQFPKAMEFTGPLGDRIQMYIEGILASREM